MASGDFLGRIHGASVVPIAWRHLAFTSGGTHEVIKGDTLTGATSTATAVVEIIVLESGSWAGGDAAGFFILREQSGTFQSENLDEGANLNVCTIAGDSDDGHAVPTYADGRQAPSFDDSTPNIAVYEMHMPDHYGAGGITVEVQWSSDTNQTTLDVRWNVYIERMQDDVDDLRTPRWSDANTIDADAPTAAGESVYDTVNFSDGADMASVAAGEPYRIAFVRHASDATNDDMTGGASLHAIAVTEQ